MTEDDLTPWQDQPFMQALTADGTDTELAGEKAALTAFHKSSARGRRGVVRLLGTGVTSVALAGVVGGGVAAAAYTRALPSPVQNALHDFLGPIGVPAPAPKVPIRGGHRSTQALSGEQVHSSPAATTGEALPTSSPKAQPSPSTHATSPAASPGGTLLGGPSPTATPSALVSPQGSATPTPTVSATASAPAGDPSTWSLTSSVSSQLVPVHGNVDIGGTLVDADGQPVPDHQVAIRVHRAGTPGWVKVDVRRTDANGTVQYEAEDLTQNTALMLGAGHGVHSTPVRVVVRPALTASVTPAADGTSYVVTVTADGGQPGDVVDLIRHTPSGWVQVGQSQLDSSDSASFSVPAPKRARGYVLRLPATKLHGVAATRVVLKPLQ